jgi:hypothetical protein
MIVDVAHNMKNLRKEETEVYESSTLENLEVENTSMPVSLKELKSGGSKILNLHCAPTPHNDTFLVFVLIICLLLVKVVYSHSSRD